MCIRDRYGTLEAEIFRDKDLKRCAVCGSVFVPKSNRAKYCPGLSLIHILLCGRNWQRENYVCCPLRIFRCAMISPFYGGAGVCLQTATGRFLILCKAWETTQFQQK